MIIYPLSSAEEKTVRWSGFILLFIAVSALALLAALSSAG